MIQQTSTATDRRSPATIVRPTHEAGQNGHDGLNGQAGWCAFLHPSSFIPHPSSFLLHPFLFLLLFLPALLPAQFGPKVVSATASVEPAEARRGEVVRLVVTATVDSQYHLYAMKQPTEAPGPIPTTIKLDDASAALVSPLGDWVEPEPKIKFDQGFEMDVATLYGSPLTFSREFVVATGASPGEVELKATLGYQACTETSCLPPARVPIAVKLVVLEGEAAAPAPTPAPTPQPTATPAPMAEPAVAPDVPPAAANVSVTDAAVAQGSFPRFLLAAFLFGLLALATPCVFPMIPITITFFTGKAATSHGQAAKYAAVYVLSIIAGFTLIGFGFSLLLLALGAGVERSGFANMIASNPWINLFFAGLYIVFALSLFEVFEIRLPMAVSARLNQGALGSSGYASIFFKALVFVVISFTCTAPLLGVLIVQTLQGEWTRPLFGMMAFATGFALPFFVLALVPQMLGRLPRAGSWLYATKVVMALLVLAAAFKFLSNTDIVWLGRGMILTREVLLSVWTAIAVVIALYLFRLVRLREDDDDAGIGPLRMLLGTVFAVLTLYLASGLFGGRLHTWIEAYMPPDLSPKGTVVGGAGVATTNPKQLYRWFDDVEEAKAEARRTGRNLFLDFTGYTCTNCRLMEKDMFPRPEVSRLMGEYVLVELYTDDPEVGEKWQGYQARLFNTVALPFYAIVTPDETIIAKAEYTRDEAAFVTFLKSGLKGTELARAAGQ